MSVRIFLSYARSDDEAFARRLYHGLTGAGFDVWFDRVSMPSRQLSFSKEIEDAISACDRLLLLVGPAAVSSDYVTHEWRFAFHKAVICVNPIVRLNGVDAAGKAVDGYELLPEDLRGPHVEDFRDDSAFDHHLANLVRQLSEALLPLGKLVAVPSLPDHYLEQGDRIRALRDMLLADLKKPVVVSGASGRVGLHGMGGIGKSLLANALARRPEIRREFPDGVFWVTLGQQPLLVELQRNVAKALGDDAVFTSDVQGRERLRELLKDRAALLILDDVWQRDHAEAFNVIGPRCRLLLTTRDAGLVTALAAKENHYQVQLPTAPEAGYILAKAAGIENPSLLPSEADTVVEECDRLPLALALCGGMVYAGTSWADLLEALEEHDLKFLSDAHSGEEQHANIWKAIDVSVRVLPEDERRRFAELAVFALETGVPEAAVETFWEHTAGLSPRNARKLLRDFSARSLVQLDTAVGRMTLHDLVHNFATGMSADPAALHSALLDGYRKKCPDDWPSGPNDGYFLENLCSHLVAAGQAQDAAVLLRSARWGFAKCAAGLVFSLEKDFGVVAQDETLRLLHGAVVLSIHVLVKEPGQYAPQMVGRLLSLKERAELGEFLDEIVEKAPRPWFRPVQSCFDSPGGTLVRTLAGHGNPVHTVAVTSDGKRVVSGSWDATVKIWDLETGHLLHTLEGHSHNVTGVAITADRTLVISAGDTTVRLWDLETGRALHTLSGHEKYIESLAVTPDGRRAISASFTVKLWDLERLAEIYTLENEPRGWCKSVAMRADGKLAVCGCYQYLDVWDLETGRMLARLEGHTKHVNSVTLTPDGTRAASGSDDGTVRIWDLAAGAVLGVFVTGSKAVHGVAFSRDGKQLASAQSDKTVTIWNVESGLKVQTLVSHTTWVNAVAFTPDGQRIVSASGDGTLKIWNVESAQPSRELDGHPWRVTSAAMTADGSRAVTASGALKFWDVTNGSVLRTLDCGGSLKIALASKTNKLAFSNGFHVRVWDLEADVEWSTLRGEFPLVNCFAVTADGRRAVVADGLRKLNLWDLQTGALLRTIEDRGPYSIQRIAVTPDGRFAVSDGSGGELRLWDLESGELVHTVESGSRTVCCVTMEPDGKHVISGGLDGTLSVWDLDRFRCVRVLKGHSKWANHLAVTNDGKRLVSVSEDFTVKAWDLGLAATLATFQCDSEAESCACSDGQHIVVGDKGGRVYFLSLEE